MRDGRLVRFEEITRCPLEVQDCLLSPLSDRVLAIPELTGPEAMVFARDGFNIIATANTRDRGVNDMSSALKRRSAACGSVCDEFVDDASDPTAVVIRVQNDTGGTVTFSLGPCGEDELVIADGNGKAVKRDAPCLTCQGVQDNPEIACTLECPIETLEVALHANQLLRLRFRLGGFGRSGLLLRLCFPRPADAAVGADGSQQNREGQQNRNELLHRLPP